MYERNFTWSGFESWKFKYIVHFYFRITGSCFVLGVGAGKAPENWKEEKNEAGTEPRWDGCTLTPRPLWKPHGRKAGGIYLLSAKLQSGTGFLWWKLREANAWLGFFQWGTLWTLPMLLTPPSSGGRSSKRLRIFSPSYISKPHHLKMEYQKN